MDKYNTIGSRFFAALADWIILFLTGLLFNTITNNLLPDNTVISYLSSFISSSYSIIYFIILHGRYGQSIGKMIMNVKIVSFPDENPISYKKAIIRDLPFLILTVMDIFIRLILFVFPSISVNFTLAFLITLCDWTGLIWFILEIVTMLSNDQRRAIHDKLAKTVVINLSPPESESKKIN